MVPSWIHVFLLWVFQFSKGGGDVFRVWQGGWGTCKLLLPAHLRPLTIIIPNIRELLCAFFCLYPSLPLWLFYPSLCLPNIQTSQPACWWEPSLFHLLNFPSSGRFMRGSYTSVPLFLLNSLLGLCAGGMREQCWLSRIPVQALSHCHMIPCYFLSSLLSAFVHVFIPAWRNAECCTMLLV